MINSYKIKKSLKSEKESLQIIEPLLFDLKKKFSISDERFYNMLIAITEALNNAILHGNKSDSSKNVIISIQIKNGLALINIIDEGEGFDLEGVPDPRDPENLLKTNGRGIFLIRSLMDDVDFKISKKGTKLTMSIAVS
jgi:serine/threonine-protein kinase RsbW